MVNIVVRSFGNTYDEAREKASKLILDSVNKLINDQKIVKITNSRYCN